MTGAFQLPGVQCSGEDLGGQSSLRSLAKKEQARYDDYDIL